MCVRVHAVEDIALLFRCMHSSSQPSVRRFLHNRHVLMPVLFDGEERKSRFCSSRNLSHRNVHLEVQRSVTLKWWREPSASSALSRTAGTCVQARLQTVKVVQTVRVGFPFSRMQSFWSPLRKLRARLLPYYSAYSIFVNDAYQAQSVQSTNAAQKGPARDKVSIPRRRHPLTHTRVYHLHTLKHVKLNQSLTRMVCDAIYVIPSRQRKKDPNKSLDAAIQRRRHNLSVFLPPSQQTQHTHPASPGSSFPAPNPNIGGTLGMAASCIK